MPAGSEAEQRRAGLSGHLLTQAWLETSWGPGWAEGQCERLTGQEEQKSTKHTLPRVPWRNGGTWAEEGTLAPGNLSLPSRAALAEQDGATRQAQLC